MGNTPGRMNADKKQKHYALIKEHATITETVLSPELADGRLSRKAGHAIARDDA
jgi:hypothetical protein